MGVGSSFLDMKANFYFFINMFSVWEHTYILHSMCVEVRGKLWEVVFFFHLRVLETELSLPGSEVDIFTAWSIWRAPEEMFLWCFTCISRLQNVTRVTQGWGHGWAVECLPSMGLILSTEEKERNEFKELPRPEAQTHLPSPAWLISYIFLTHLRIRW